MAVGSGLSSWGLVSSGVPQGSVLRPVLFLLYVNDIPKLLSSQVMMLADGIKVYCAIQDITDQRLLQNDLNVLEQLSWDWLLRCNINKCRVMYCGSSNPKQPYDMEVE